MATGVRTLQQSTFFLALDVGRTNTRVATMAQRQNSPIDYKGFKNITDWPFAPRKACDTVPTVVAVSITNKEAMYWGHDAERRCHWESEAHLRFTALKTAMIPAGSCPQDLIEEEQKLARENGLDLADLAMYFVHSVLKHAMHRTDQYRQRIILASVPVQWEESGRDAKSPYFTILQTIKESNDAIYFVDEPTAAGVGLLFDSQSKSELYEEEESTRLYTVMDCGSLTTDYATMEVFQRQGGLECKVLARDAILCGSADIDHAALKPFADKGQLVMNAMQDHLEGLKPSMEERSADATAPKASWWTFGETLFDEYARTAREMDEKINFARYEQLMSHLEATSGPARTRKRTLLLTGGGSGSVTLQQKIGDSSFDEVKFGTQLNEGCNNIEGTQHGLRGLALLAECPHLGTSCEAPFAVFLKHDLAFTWGTNFKDHEGARLWEEGCPHRTYDDERKKWFWKSSRLEFDLSRNLNDPFTLDLTTMTPRNPNTITLRTKKKYGKYKKAQILFKTASPDQLVSLQELTTGKLDMTTSDFWASAVVFGRHVLRSIALRVIYRTDGQRFTTADNKLVDEVLEAGPFSDLSEIIGQSQLRVTELQSTANIPTAKRLRPKEAGTANIPTAKRLRPKEAGTANIPTAKRLRPKEAGTANIPTAKRLRPKEADEGYETDADSDSDSDSDLGIFVSE